MGLVAFCASACLTLPSRKLDELIHNSMSARRHQEHWYIRVRPAKSVLPASAISPRSSAPGGQCPSPADPEHTNVTPAFSSDSSTSAPNPDWRSFRASLVKQEAREKPPKTAIPASNGQGVFWAHVITAVEKGCVLVARPGAIDDEFFEKSVVLVLAHDEDGTFGLALNKPIALMSSVQTSTSTSVGISFEDAKNGLLADTTLYNGGPLDLDTLHALHSMPDLTRASTVIPGVYTSSLNTVVTALRNGGLVADCKFLAGYAGWGFSQLESEIADGVWTVAATNPEFVTLPCPHGEGCAMWELLNDELGVGLSE
jgi:putative transcriptional regulator